MFVRVFPYGVMEKFEQTFWPTQYYWALGLERWGEVILYKAWHTAGAQWMVTAVHIVAKSGPPAGALSHEGGKKQSWLELIASWAWSLSPVEVKEARCLPTRGVRWLDGLGEPGVCSFLSVALRSRDGMVGPKVTVCRMGLALVFAVVTLWPGKRLTREVLEAAPWRWGVGPVGEQPPPASGVLISWLHRWPCSILAFPAAWELFWKWGSPPSCRNIAPPRMGSGGEHGV